MKTNNEMISDIMNEIDNVKNKRRINGKATVILITTMCLVFCIGIGAFATRYYYPIGSEEWLEQVKQNASNATGEEAAEEFRERMRNTDDIYSKNGVKYGYDEVIINYETSVPVNQVKECGNFVFNFKSITEGDVLKRVLISGSPMKGTGEYEWQVKKHHFALFEVTRTDGQKFSEENYINFRMLRFVEGYDPFTTNMCLEGVCPEIEIITDDTLYIAVGITNMLIFAENDLYLTAIDFLGEFDMFEHIYVSTNGDIMLKDNAPENSVIFRFNIDKSFADKKAVKKFVKTYNIDNSFYTYTK